MQGMTFNRLDVDVINWNYVELVEVNNEKNVAVIYFHSGNTKRIDGDETVKNLIDMFSVFPNINDEETRRAIKAASAESSPVKTERTMARMPAEAKRKTDINPHDIKA
jgi:hypothetical protein